jgi:hypothetical protein
MQQDSRAEAARAQHATGPRQAADGARGGPADGRAHAAKTRGGRAAAAACLGLLGLAAAQPAAHAQPADAPARNLLIELRQVDAQQAQAGGLGVDGGAVVVHSDGRVSGGLSGGAQVRSSRGSAVMSQQLRVMNGMPASIRLGQSLPLQLWQAWLTPQGVQAVPTTVFVEAGQGFAVRPSWPGGAAPVTLEVVSESSQFAQPGRVSRWDRAVAETRAARGEALPPGAAGAVDTARVLTTLAVPLGQWVTLAETGGSSLREDRGLLSTSQVDRSGAMRLEVRVTAP